MPNTPRTKARQLAEKLRFACEISLIAPNDRVFAISASLGISSQNQSLRGSEILCRADRALHQAKNDGKNCIREFTGKSINPTAVDRATSADCRREEFTAMRFTVVTYGSEGDTRPFVALCRGLMDAGHEVLFFAEQSSTYIAHQHGIPVETLAGDVKTILPLDSPSQELTPRELVKTVRTGLRSINANVAAWMAAVARHAQTADAVLHSGLASLVAQVVAQEVDKPAISLCSSPRRPPGNSPLRYCRYGTCPAGSIG